MTIHLSTSQTWTIRCKIPERNVDHQLNREPEPRAHGTTYKRTEEQNVINRVNLRKDEGTNVVDEVKKLWQQVKFKNDGFMPKN